MRIAVFGDIHGNLAALETVLSDIPRRQVDAIYCLGDLVGYGAFPNEVIDRIRNGRIPTIMGNYDDGVGFDRDECGCAYREPEEKKRGDRSLAWTKSHVTPSNKAYLQTLLPDVRLEANGRRVLLVHGSPRKINEYLFEDRPLSSFQRLAASSNADMVVFGHTHRPYTKLVDNVWFVNAGSVGKPKDRDWRACYVLLEPGAANPARFIRLEYDIRSMTDAIRATDLPPEFATDLETAGAPAR